MKKKKSTKKFESYELKKQKYVNEDYQQVRSFFIIGIIVLVLAGILFVVNAKYVTKDKFQNNEEETEEIKIDSSYITIDDMFKMNEEEYLVLLYDSKDTKTSSVYNNLLNFYYGTKALYKVDLANPMNKSHYSASNVDNKNPTSASEVKVSGLTLITIKKGKVTSYLTDTEEILKQVK